MKAADAAGLVAARTGHVVEQAVAALGGVLQAGDDTLRLEDRVRRSVVALHEAEGRLQVRDCKADRGRSDRAPGQKFLGQQNGAAIEFGKMRGIEEPRLEVARQVCVSQKPVAIDLVFKRRFLEGARL